MFNRPPNKDEKYRKKQFAKLHIAAFVRDSSTGLYLPQGLREKSDGNKLGKSNKPQVST
jgi:hypothetical protein